MAQTMMFPAFVKYEQHLKVETSREIDMYKSSGDLALRVGLGDVNDIPKSDERYIWPDVNRITLPSRFELMDDDDLVPVMLGLILYAADGGYLTFADAKSILQRSPFLMSANGGLQNGMHATRSLGWITCMGADFTAIARIGIPMTTGGQQADKGFAIRVFVPNLTAEAQVIKPSPAPMLASRDLLQRLYEAFVAE